MKSQEKRILEVLLNSTVPLSALAIAEKTGFTDRYVRSVLKEMEKYGKEEGYCIETLFRKGTTLRILDETLFHTAFSSDAQTISNEILCYLLNAETPVFYSTLEEAFYITHTALVNHMKAASQQASKYHLTIQYRSDTGFYIEGEEQDKRKCYIHTHHRTSSEMESLHKIEEIVASILEKHQFNMSDNNFSTLCFHLLIALERAEKQEYISEIMPMKEAHPEQEEIAEEILTSLTDCFSVSFPETEKYYLTLHLLGKQTLEEDGEILPETQELASSILDTIQKKSNIHLHYTIELFTSLCLHLQPMLFRLKYHLSQSNPLKDNTKREFPIAYDLALIASEVIEHTFQLSVPEDEVGYLALHFALALDKHETPTDKKIVLVCSSGRGTARLLQHQLMSQYHLKEENITLSSALHLQNMDFSNYSCILSTIPLSMSLPIPHMVVSPVIQSIKSDKVKQFLVSQFQKTDLIQEDSFITLSLQSREEVFAYLAEYYQLPMLYTALIERERLSSTEVGNLCALPHPYGYNVEKTCVRFIKLQEPVLWDTQKVQLVVFAAYRPDCIETTISDQIIHLVSDPVLVQRLLQNFSYATYLSLCEETV